jgi:hypothetical protein
MSISLDYIAIAQIEQEIKTVMTRLDEHEKWLRNQILTDFPKCGTNAAQLAGVRVQRELFPEWLKLQRAEIFRLQSEIERQKNQ